MAEYIRDGLLDAETFAAKSEPKDLFELVRKEDIDELISIFPVIRLHYVATDGCPKCRQETLIEAKNLQITVIKEPDAKTRADEFVRYITTHRLCF